MKLVRVALAVAALAVCGASTAQASHIFSTNITIDGTPVAAGNAFTDPVINALVGVPITFSFDLFGDADTFNVSFFDGGGSTLPVPANASFAYNGTGTLATPVVFSFTRTFGAVGLFNGILIPDFPVSFPDYLFPGGGQTSEPQIPFTIQVSANNGSVPEPATMALACLGGLGLIGYRRRLKKAPVA